MSRGWRPILVGAAVVVAVFLLAQWPIFEPAESGSATATEGDAARGQTLFESTCASCHGQTGEGGVGPQLAGSGLSAEEVATTIEQGAGVMPAGLVQGQDQADVVAYVVSIAES